MRLQSLRYIERAAVCGDTTQQLDVFLDRAIWYANTIVSHAIAMCCWLWSCMVVQPIQGWPVPCSPWGLWSSAARKCQQCWGTLLARIFTLGWSNSRGTCADQLWGRAPSSHFLYLNYACAESEHDSLLKWSCQRPRYWIDVDKWQRSTFYHQTQRSPQEDKARTEKGEELLCKHVQVKLISNLCDVVLSIKG